MKDLDDPELAELASKLPETIKARRAEATTRKYPGAYRQWKGWAHQRDMEVIPEKNFQFALYLQHLADTTKFEAAVDEACNAQVWVHSTAGPVAPTSAPFVCASRDGFQRSLAKAAVKKSPAKVEMKRLGLLQVAAQPRLMLLWCEGC